MYNLDFLNKGGIYPPIEEAQRLGAYTDFDLMFDSDSEAVERKFYRTSLKQIKNLAVKLGFTEYIGVEYNYYWLTSVKTADFVCGEYPSITGINNHENEVINQIIIDTKFNDKHYDSWIDVSKYGNAIFKIYKNGSKNTFTLNNPSLWIEIVDPSDPYNTINHFIGWIELLNGKTILKCQIHSKGSYEERTYAIKPASYLNAQTARYSFLSSEKGSLYQLYLDKLTGEIFRFTPYEIGDLLSQKTIATGLKDFAIIKLTNIKSSDKIYGKSDYTAFDSIIAQNQRIMSEIQMLFDKYTLPTAYAPISSLTNNNGQGIFEVGGCIGIPDGSTILPGYLTPDIQSITQMFTALTHNFERMKELSEMGAVFDCALSGSNISTDTMQGKFTSALKKAERLTTKNTDAIKKLISLISQTGYSPIPEENISIEWCDGLPNNETTEVANASAKILAGLSTRKRENVNRFNMTLEDADKIYSEVLEEKEDFSQQTFMGNNTEV